MDFLLKGRGEYRGIGIEGVVWKSYMAVANCWLQRSVYMHDELHGFRAGRGTCTATLEAKLVQQLAGLVHDPLLQVFLDVCKSYDSSVY